MLPVWKRFWLVPAFALFRVAVAADFSPAVDVTIPSTLDRTPQRALLYVPPRASLGGAPAPLLVHLHSWSSDYRNSSKMKAALEETVRRGWIFLSPDFRGPNDRPQACGSSLAVQDVIDAVAYVQGKAAVDRRRIYLLGGSGGGHMALLMAARAPRLWAAVSAWVPISDLTDWHRSTRKAGLRYAQMMENCAGGPPGKAPGEYRERSPLPHLAAAAELPVSIEAGIHDGHGEASVPVSQTLHAFNALAKANGHPEQVLKPEAIRQITETESIPAALRAHSGMEPDRLFPVLMRRRAGPVQVTIFEGAHDTDFLTGIRWLSSFRKSAGSR